MGSAHGCAVQLRRINCQPVKQTDSSQQNQLVTWHRKNLFGFCNSRKGLKKTGHVRWPQETGRRRNDHTMGVGYLASILKGGRETHFNFLL